MKTEEKDPQIHHEDCGDVGETGEHGDLGANAVDAERETKLPSGADLDLDAAEKAIAQATAAGNAAVDAVLAERGKVVTVPPATGAKPAPNAGEIKAQIAGSLVLAGYSPEEAARMAETAWANKQEAAGAQS